MNLKRRVERLEAAARRGGLTVRKAVARVWIQPDWDALSDDERYAELCARPVIILPDNGREAVHHAA